MKFFLLSMILTFIGLTGCTAPASLTKTSTQATATPAAAPDNRTPGEIRLDSNPQILTARNNGAKFRYSKDYRAGNTTFEWDGPVNGKGFADGRGTRTVYRSEHMPSSHETANYRDGMHAEGQYESTSYNDAGRPVWFSTGGYDSEGRQHGTCISTKSKMMVGEDNPKETVKYETEYSHGYDQKRITTYADGSQETSKGLGDFIAERQQKLRNDAAAYSQQLADERADRQAENNAALLRGLSKGLAETARSAESGAGTSGSKPYQPPMWITTYKKSPPPQGYRPGSKKPKPSVPSLPVGSSNQKKSGACVNGGPKFNGCSGYPCTCKTMNK